VLINPHPLKLAQFKRSAVKLVLGCIGPFMAAERIAYCLHMVSICTGSTISNIDH
ncbi:hypothetical protein PENSPDRAFT_553847, partial [Peniophora sp. CONT]